MVNLIMSFIITMVAVFAPSQAYAKDIDFARADQLIRKYNTNIERPKSCPMESKKFADMIARTDALKDVLKGNCLQKDDEKLTEIMDSIKGIQNELTTNDALNTPSALTQALGGITNTATATATATSTSTDNSLSGLKFSAVFSNLTTMFKKSQCNMEDGRVLQTAADFIFDSTQLGVLAGSQLGLVVAGGGFLISSALRLIDLIFKKRFDFDKTTDRQTFVKLNCSFYEIRRELDVNGGLDIENNTSKDDYRDIKAIVEDMNNEFKRMDEEKANLTKTHSEIDKATFAENVADLTDFKKTLNKVQRYLLAGAVPSEIPSETQKLLMISQLAQDYDLLVTSINYYKTLKVSSIPMLDDLFLVEMKRFDSLNLVAFNETMNIVAKDFNENYRSKILFHLMRISNDIAAKENTLSDQSQKAKVDRGTFLDKKKEDYLKKFVEIKKVETRLGNVVAPKEYSGFDDGTENMVAILDNHKKISSELYGEWGDKFLKFATYKSADSIKDFNDRLKVFNNKYSEMIKSGDTQNLSTTYLCQDAQKLRLIFKQADSIVQEGFDFIVTNKDILNTDVKNYYNRTLDEEKSFATLSSVEKIQRHYRSAIYALKFLKGETVPDDMKERYLTKYLGAFYIGKLMVDVSAAKVKAKNVQDIYERLGCQKSLADDLGN